MTSKPIFQDLPLVGLITNFEANGAFEKVYMLTAERKQQAAPIAMRKTIPLNRTWNGPNLESMVEKWSR